MSLDVSNFHLYSGLRYSISARVYWPAPLRSAVITDSYGPGSMHYGVRSDYRPYFTSRIQATSVAVQRIELVLQSPLESLGLGGTRCLSWSRLHT